MTLKELLHILQIAYATGTHEQRKVQCHAQGLLISTADLAVKLKNRQVPLGTALIYIIETSQTL